MKYLLVGDIHLADRPPSSCTETYTDDLFDLLEQTVALEEEHDCDGTIWAGDVFHIKAASRNSHRMVQRAIDLGSKYRDWWVAAGNHDMENDRIESLVKQPLGVLYKSGAKFLDQENGPPHVLGVPWQQDWFGDFKPPQIHRDGLLVAHAPLYPRAPVHPEYVSYEWWGAQQGLGACYYGHVHDIHGATLVDEVWFCNNGAITRGSLHESELVRPVFVTVWDPSDHLPETGPFIPIMLKYKPASEVFRLAEISENKTATVRVEEFLAEVGRTQLSMVTLESVMEAGAEKLPPEDLPFLKRLLEVKQ